MKRVRITSNPHVMEGRTCIRVMPVTVSATVSHLAEGVSKDPLLQEYPHPEEEDIRPATRYAALVPEERNLPAGTA